MVIPALAFYRLHLTTKEHGYDYKFDREFWSQISADRIRRLYRAFKRDFEMFGYGVNDYMRKIGLPEKQI
jgi:hypothetical protein